MKNYYKTAAAVVLMIFGLFNLPGCKDDDSIDPKTQTINDLTATWQLVSVTNDNNDVSAQFSGFTLTIAGLNYQTQNGGNPWPGSGTYELSDVDLKTLLRSDGIAITIDQLTATNLTLSFTFNEVTGGRANGVTGGFTFLMTKQ